METLGQRIQRLRKRNNLTQAKFAEACGWESISRVGNYERDTREPSLDDLRKMARVLGVSLMEVIGEDGDGTAQPLNTLDHLSIAAAEPELIGKFEVREASSAPSTYPLPRQWLNSGRYDPRFLRLIYAPDQGMEPTIQPGDACILDIRRTQPVDRGIYLIRRGNGDLVTRRLVSLVAGAYLLQADNPHKTYFPNESINEDQLAYLPILGRIIWRGGEL